MKWMIFVLIAGAVVFNSTVTAPRGIRNNNPGNIRWVQGQNWVGQVGRDSAGFVIFDRAEHGLRALAVLLRNYSTRHGINTVRGIVNRYAPPTENDTGAYVNHVARALGVDPDDVIDVEGRMLDLVPVIVRHENGQQPYTRGQMIEGLQLAGINSRAWA